MIEYCRQWEQVGRRCESVGRQWNNVVGRQNDGKLFRDINAGFASLLHDLVNSMSKISPSR